MKYSVILVAAGSGTRMHLGFNKVYASLDNDQTILRNAMDVFLTDADCSQIIIPTIATEFHEHWEEFWPGKVLLVKGGETRQESVQNALDAVMSDYVFVHDGARPYIQEEDVEALKSALKKEKAALLAVPSKDTIKRIVDGYVKNTPKRDEMYCAYTPQAFETKLLKRCMKRAKEENFIGTDDCSIVEKYSRAKIKVVIGSYSNIKITTIEDLLRPSK